MQIDWNKESVNVYEKLSNPTGLTQGINMAIIFIALITNITAVMSGENNI